MLLSADIQQLKSKKIEWLAVGSNSDTKETMEEFE